MFSTLLLVNHLGGPWPEGCGLKRCNWKGCGLKGHGLNGRGLKGIT